MKAKEPTTPTRLSGIPLYRLPFYLVKKAMGFISRYKNNPKYLLSYTYTLLGFNKAKLENFLSHDAFLENARTTSTIRFGDGEFTLMLNVNDLHFQKRSPTLSAALWKIIREYTENSTYILGIPAYVALSNKTLAAADKLFLWMHAKTFFNSYLPRKEKYFNAHVFYTKDKTMGFIEYVSEGKNVLFVTNQNYLNGIRKKISLPKVKSIQYIITPETNAFEQIDDIFSDIVNKADPKNSIVLIACGPASKVLIYKLSNKNIIAHDMGHGFAFILGGDTPDWKSEAVFFEEQFPLL